jgi:hypothetical protein
MHANRQQEPDPSFLVGRRMAVREKIGASISARKSGSEWQPVKLVDLSTTGCRLGRVPAEFEGLSLWVRVADLDPLPVRVRWARGGEKGCEFLYKLNSRQHHRVAQVAHELREAARHDQDFRYSL